MKYVKNLDFSKRVSFLVGENGSGKSTLLEAIACRLQLPHMDGRSYAKNSFDAAKKLLPFLELTWQIERSVGFFFRAEDFGDYLNSIHRVGTTIENQMGDLGPDVPTHIINQMKESANYQLKQMRSNYGQELNAFSHGEAYLHIMNEMINTRGIYLLDEPEAALSPAKQLTLIAFIKNHLKAHNSQFIIATHSPILLAFPEASIFEITENTMEKKNLEETEHFNITKSFLNNPEAYLRHL
nr:AAA family ATPase [uncultured Polaribacter sp.]